MDKIKLIKKHLEKEKQLLLKTLEKAKETRDSAPSAMESHHDTTRNQAEKFVTALEKKLHNLEKIISDLPNPKDIISSNIITLWSYVELNLGENKMKLLVVSEGLGGKKESDINFISKNTPLGSAIFNGKIGGSFSYNDQKGEILKVG